MPPRLMFRARGVADSDERRRTGDQKLSIRLSFAISANVIGTLQCRQTSAASRCTASDEQAAEKAPAHWSPGRVGRVALLPPRRRPAWLARAGLRRGGSRATRPTLPGDQWAGAFSAACSSLAVHLLAALVCLHWSVPMTLADMAKDNRMLSFWSPVRLRSSLSATPLARNIRRGGIVSSPWTTLALGCPWC